MKKQIYLAGPLFTRGEMNDRVNDEKKIRETFKDIFNIFNPLRLNEKHQIGKDMSQISKTFFFEKDWDAIKNSHIMIADIDNNDPGTLVELGLYIALKKENPELKLYVIYSNWKGETLMNKFLLGAIYDSANFIGKNIDEIVNAMKEGK